MLQKMVAFQNVTIEHYLLKKENAIASLISEYGNSILFSTVSFPFPIFLGSRAVHDNVMNTSFTFNVDFGLCYNYKNTILCD